MTWPPNKFPGSATALAFNTVGAARFLATVQCLAPIYRSNINDIRSGEMSARRVVNDYVNKL
jgi:hypothetical protein